MKRRFDPLFTMAVSLAPSATDKLERTHLPIPEPKLTPITEFDVCNAKVTPPFEVKPSDGRWVWSATCPPSRLTANICHRWRGWLAIQPVTHNV